MKSIAILICSLIAGTYGMAADATGSYQGEFNGRRGTLTLANTNGYTLSFTAEDGSTDIVGPLCRSVLGQNTHVKIKNGVLKSLSFEFSSGICFGIDGREMVVKIKPNELSISVFAHNETLQSCHFDTIGRQYCDDMNWPVYADGKFTRQ